MDRRLQAHVLENILTNGSWIWSWNLGRDQGRVITGNPQALAKFQASGFTNDEYYTCMVMLTESSKIVAQDLERWEMYYVGYSPMCLTVEGTQYLKELKHPRWEWFKRNWFAVVVATITSLATVTATVFNIVLRIAG